MKKMLIFLLGILMIFPLISALNIEVEKKSSNEVLISGVDKPVTFDLEITNYGPAESLEFYNLIGFKMFPIGRVPISTGEKKEVQVKISPIGEFDYKGYYTFNYFIRGLDSTQVGERLTFKIVKLEDAFEIGANEFDPESNSVEIYIHNKENFDFGEINVKFSSSFFNIEEIFSIGPHEKKEFTINLNKEDFNKLIAGFYTIEAEITAQEQTAKVQGTIKFVEKNIVTTTKRDYGFVIITKSIEKTNEGNIITDTETTLKKNIISRLFTNFNPQPDYVERRGLTVDYTWEKSIKPGETFKIAVKTNWLFPLLIIFFIIAIVVLAKQYSKTDLVLKKKVSFVRAKGGEFALKVSILVNAKKHVERVSVTDRLPPLVKIHEKFGAEKPVRINEKTRRIEWNLERLEAGETRILSYVIYSKIGVVGKFALPSAIAIFEKDGEISESESNRAFFIAEQRDKEIEE
ncbi:MAG: hypothetical protein KKF68_00695 [Nanoarchaeota archaeon]|nr:hypothetical protein [Nanoarchaeota archaeon]